VQVADILNYSGVPVTRQVLAGTGLTGGGQLTSNVTLSVAAGGIGPTQLANTGVAAGTYGDASNAVTVGVDAQGRITSITTSPVVISGFVPVTRQVIAGVGLTGGGALTGNVTLSADFSATTPLSVDTTGSAGVANEISRSDHTHPAIDLADDDQVDGLLGLDNGGTGRSLVPVAGSIVYSGADGLYIGSSGTSGQVLVSAGNSGYTWGNVALLSDQPANVFYAGPTAGPDAPVTFRSLVNADLPNSGVAASTYGSATAIPVIAVNAKGVITGVTTQAVTATNIVGGSANQIVFNTAANTTSFIAAPTIASTYLEWNGAAFQWSANPLGTVTSVNLSGGTTGLTTSGGPITTSGTITLAGTLAVANGGTGITSFGAGVATWLGTPSSANLAAAVTDETGSGALVFANSPTLVTPTLGTPASVTLTNATGLPTAGLVDNAVTNEKLRDSGALSVIGRSANSTGNPADISAGANHQVLRRDGSSLGFGAVDLSSNQAVTGTLPVNQGGTGITSFGSGVATWLGTPSSANLAAAVTDETGTGALVFANSPTLVTPALGTPASGVVTNLTGTASININGTVGATTPAAGAFTTLNTSGAVVFNEAGANVDFRVEGDTEPNLLFVDASADNVGIGTSSIDTSDFFSSVPRAVIQNTGNIALRLSNSTTANGIGVSGLSFAAGDGSGNQKDIAIIRAETAAINGGAGVLQFYTRPSGGTNTERLRIDSTGNVGIGTSSPFGKLDVQNGTVFVGQSAGTSQQNNLLAGYGQVFGGSTYGNVSIRSTYEGSNNSASLDFFTAPSGTTSTEQMRLNSTGLEVKGKLAVGYSDFSGIPTNGAAFAGSVGIGTSSPATALSFPIGTNKFVGQTATTTHQAGNAGSIGFGISDGGGQTGVFVYNTHNGTYSSQDIRFLTAEGGISAATERMRITPTGNLGLGVTPSAWISGYKALEITSSGGIAGDGVADVLVLQNLYLNTSAQWIRRNAQAGGIYNINGAIHSWTTTPTGTAGSVATLTQAMTLDASGNLLVGTTTALLTGPNRGNITVNGSTDSILTLGVAGSWGAYLTANSSNAELASEGSRYLSFSTNGSERARITSDAYLRMASGSGGIQFNGDTAAANALDDYEEGDWTPTLEFGGASVGITYNASYQSGKYTKIGRQVTVTGFFQLTSKGSSSGDATIAGLPFALGGDTSFYSVASFRAEAVSFANQLMGSAQFGTSVLNYIEATEAGVLTSLTDAEFTNVSNTMISFTYFTA
jgi:hypothetical protein